MKKNYRGQSCWSLTISLVVECDKLDAVQPEGERIGVGGVDASGRRVGAEQLALRVSDQLGGVTATQALGGVLVHR